MADPDRLNMAFLSGAPDLVDYGRIRYEVKSAHEKITKNASSVGTDYSVGRTYNGATIDRYQSNADPDLKMHEVFEWTRPFDDEYTVTVNDVPIFEGGTMPIPYDYKEASFISIPYLKPPGEFEGYGIPMILENPQIMLNLIKNQRIDAVTMSIHKMWVVNPLANINKNELVTRPFGIIYSNDPNGVREIQFSDIKPSAYTEEESLKSDMRYASGVDDFSMGGGSNAGSATEVRHLRESTLERVRLFSNHLGEGLSTVMRYWFTMYQQFFTKSMTIRIVGEDGADLYPLIEKDDLAGNFDFISKVIPSIQGQDDVEKKQFMDFFQMISGLEGVNTREMIGVLANKFGISPDKVLAEEPQGTGEVMPPGGDPSQMGMDPMGMPFGQPPAMPQEGMPAQDFGVVSPEVADEMLRLMGTDPSAGGQPTMSPQQLMSSFAQVPQPGQGGQGGLPDQDRKKVGKTTNVAGHNRNGKPNRTLNINRNSNPTSALLNRTFNLQ